MKAIKWLLFISTLFKLTFGSALATSDLSGSGILVHDLKVLENLFHEYTERKEDTERTAEHNLLDSVAENILSSRAVLCPTKTAVTGFRNIFLALFPAIVPVVGKRMADNRGIVLSALCEKPGYKI
ncbi:hypothetical protein ACJU26_09540 [Acidithiobacillus sp. M4-SHS-6]|uniref:hypothetical protein n=1 Tax=Acidithiobacillus sp. M4-SHS-6 TaxID=3383024 RepID=UPI0039BDAE28